MKKNKEYIKISDNISIYPVIINLHKQDLLTNYKDNQVIRILQNQPSITIREFIRLKMISYAYDCINEQRKGFYISF
jgi:hypothetical protein